MVLTGYNFGRVPGTVYTNVLGRDYKEVISDSQHVQTVELMGCSMVNFTVSSNQPENSIMLILTVQEEAVSELDETYVYESVRKAYSDNLLCSIQSEYPPCTALLTTPVFINVTLEACPLGFELSKLTGMCDCAKGLKAIEDVFLTFEIM